MVHRWAINDAGKIPWMNSYLEEFGLEAGRTHFKKDSSGRFSIIERAEKFTIISDANGTGSWTASGGTLSLEGSIYFEEDGSIKTVSTASGSGTCSVTYTLASSVNWSELFLGMWVYITSTNVQTPYLEIEDTLGRIGRYNVTIPAANSWFFAKAQIMEYTGATATKSKKTPDAEPSGAVDLTAIKKVRFSIKEQSTPVNPTIYIDLVHRLDAWVTWEISWGTSGISSVVRKSYHQGANVLTSTFNYGSDGGVLSISKVIS